MEDGPVVLARAYPSPQSWGLPKACLGLTFYQIALALRLPRPLEQTLGGLLLCPLGSVLVSSHLRGAQGWVSFLGHHCRLQRMVAAWIYPVRSNAGFLSVARPDLGPPALLFSSTAGLALAVVSCLQPVYVQCKKVQFY